MKDDLSTTCKWIFKQFFWLCAHYLQTNLTTTDNNKVLTSKKNAFYIT